MKNVKSLSDEDLVEVVRNRDQELYREIVNRYQEKLLRYANYLIGDNDKAADVVQEAFVKAFVNLQGFDVKRKFSSWIYRIVHNEAINYIKKYKKEISLEGNNFVNILKKDEDIEEDFEKKEIKKRVRQCLKALSVKYREPLVLYFLE